MSTPDTMTSLLSTPWFGSDGQKLSVRSLPGLRPDVVKTLESTFPGMIKPPLKGLLDRSCGLADTPLGHVDFTGCCFPAEGCAVFRPCLTLAVDDAGRRWIAEARDQALPGPVWCVFPDPAVAVFISEDLSSFITRLREAATHDQCLTWLRELNATAQAVWSQRRTLALRPYSVHQADVAIRGWLSSLPPDAYVYDLRQEHAVRGWPYGVAGPSSRLYRYGRLPVFAVVAAPTEGWHAGRPDTTSPRYPVSALGREFEIPEVLTSGPREKSAPRRSSSSSHRHLRSAAARGGVRSTSTRYATRAAGRPAHRMGCSSARTTLELFRAIPTSVSRCVGMVPVRFRDI